MDIPTMIQANLFININGKENIMQCLLSSGNIVMIFFFLHGHDRHIYIFSIRTQKKLKCRVSNFFCGSSAVNGCHQNESYHNNPRAIYMTPVHQYLVEVKSCLFVRNKSIKIFLTSNHYFQLKYESSIHNIAFSSHLII